MPFVCADRAEGLAKLGHEVHVLTTGPTAGHEPIEELNGVQVHHLPCEPMVYSQKFSELLREACKALRPAILHLDSIDPAPGQNPPWWHDRPGGAKATAVTIHGASWGGFLTTWNQRRLGLLGSCADYNEQKFLREASILSFADRVLTMNLHEQRLMEDHYGLYGKVRLVRNPIPDYFFTEPLQPLPAKPTMLFTAVSGQGPRRLESARAAAKAAGVDLLEVSGIPRSDMPYAYDAATALVLPTTYAQGYDMTIYEALVRGRGVIISATGAYLFETRHGELSDCPGVRLVRLGDHDELVEAMRNPPKMTDAGAADARWAMNEHRVGKHVDNWLEAVIG
jgi:glycosyltransferase involved in cell wall biosynthesis